MLALFARSTESQFIQRHDNGLPKCWLQIRSIDCLFAFMLLWSSKRLVQDICFTASIFMNPSSLGISVSTGQSVKRARRTLRSSTLEMGYYQNYALIPCQLLSSRLIALESWIYQPLHSPTYCRRYYITRPGDYLSAALTWQHAGCASCSGSSPCPFQKEDTQCIKPTAKPEYFAAGS